MFVNVPIGIAVWIVGRTVLAETPRRSGRFDLAGAATSTLGMTGIVLGLVEAGSDGWTSPVTVGSLVGGALLLALFVRTEARAAEPVLPLRLFANPTRNDRQRCPRTHLRRHVRDVLLPVAIPPGRPALLAVAGRTRLPAHADLGVPVVAARQPSARPAPPATGGHAHGRHPRRGQHAAGDPAAGRHHVPSDRRLPRPHGRRRRHLVREPHVGVSGRRGTGGRRGSLRAHQRQPADRRRPRARRPRLGLQRVERSRPARRDRPPGRGAHLHSLVGGSTTSSRSGPSSPWRPWCWWRSRSGLRCPSRRWPRSRRRSGRRRRDGALAGRPLAVVAPLTQAPHRATRPRGPSPSSCFGRTRPSAS
jgi:hypothetical protein